MNDRFAGESAASGGSKRQKPRSASVVIPVLNGVPLLSEQLQALERQQEPGVPWDIVVADNGSDDGTLELVQAWLERLPKIILIDAAATAGASHARNVGAAIAPGELLCFCDADDVVSPDWLAAHVSVAPMHDFAGGPLDVHHLNRESVRRWRPTPRTALGKGPARFAPSGNMSIWKDVFLQLGGFDEQYLKSHDVELSQRAQAAGFRMGWVPEAVVHYRLRSSLQSFAHQAFRAGRASIQMSLDHPHAAPRPSWRREIGGWLRALIRLPALLVASRRGPTVRILAEQAGRLDGILRFRKRLRSTKDPTSRKERLP